VLATPYTQKGGGEDLEKVHPLEKRTYYFQGADNLEEGKCEGEDVASYSEKEELRN